MPRAEKKEREIKPPKRILVIADGLIPKDADLSDVENFFAYWDLEEDLDVERLKEKYAILNKNSAK